MSTAKYVNPAKEKSSKRMIDIVLPILRNEISFFEKGLFMFTENNDNPICKNLDRNHCVDLICIPLVCKVCKEKKIEIEGDITFISSRCTVSDKKRKSFSLRVRRENPDGTPGKKTEFFKLLDLIKESDVRSDIIIQANIVNERFLELGIIKSDSLIRFLDLYRKSNCLYEIKVVDDDLSVAWFWSITWKLLRDNGIKFLSKEFYLPYKKAATFDDSNNGDFIENVNIDIDEDMSDVINNIILIWKEKNGRK